MKKIGGWIGVFAVILLFSFGCGCIGNAPIVEPIPIVNTTPVVNTTIVEEVIQLELCPIYEERDVFETRNIYESQDVFETRSVFESQPIYETRYNLVVSIHGIFSTDVIERNDLTKAEATEFLKRVDRETAVWETVTIEKETYEKVVEHEDVLVGHEEVVVGQKEVLIGHEEVKVGTEFVIVGFEKVPLGTCVRKEGTIDITEEAFSIGVRLETEIELESKPEPTLVATVEEEERNVHITVDYVAKVLFVKKDGTYEYDWYDAPKSDADIEKAVWKKVDEVAAEYHAKVVSVDIKIEDF